MKKERVLESGVEVDHSVDSTSDGEALEVGLVNVRILADRNFCRKIAVLLEPLGLITTGFEPDPHGTPNVYRMFLAGKLGGE